MNIGEMHIMFRQYAQQMGMQNVRAILPEQIDLLLNTSIVDTTNELVRSTVGVTNDRIITDSSKILQINSLKNIYKVARLSFIPTNGTNPVAACFLPDKSRSAVGKFVANVKRSETDVNYFIFPEYMYIVDFSIDYVRASHGYSDSPTGSNTGVVADTANPFISNLYPVRLIDDAFLADVLNDFTTKNRLRSPIIIAYDNTFELYIDKLTKDPSKGYLLRQGLVPNELRFSYIARPAIVKYLDDIDPDKSVDCDLPENLHVDIVKHAVDLYRIAISNTTFQRPQSQSNQENADKQSAQ